MKRAVAVDTTTWWGGVALVSRTGDSPPEVVAEIAALVGKSHSAMILKWIELLLAQAGWAKSELDLFAAARGPGSFTGIRVGLGTIRGLSLASDRPAVGVSALAALAEAHGPAECDRLTLMDAGRGQVYGARYDPGSFPPDEIEAAWVGSPDLHDKLRTPAVIVPGSGTSAPSGLPAGGVRVASSPHGIAAAVGKIAMDRMESERVDPLSPLYLRPPDALFKRQGV